MKSNRQSPFIERLKWLWQYVIDFAITLWVLRAPIVFTAFAALLLGQTPQAQDLFVELPRRESWRPVFFLSVLFLAWSMPVHYASRVLLRSDTRYQKRVRARGGWLKWLNKHSPRAVGLTAYGIMLMCVRRSFNNLPVDGLKDVESSLKGFAIGICIAAVLFYFYAVYRETMMGYASAKWPRRFSRWATEKLEKLLGKSKAVKSTAITSRLGPVGLLFFALFLSAWPLFWPEDFANSFPRASLVPFVVGAWIPLLSYLSVLGRRDHVPYLTFFILGISFLSLFFGDDYKVRTTEPQNAGRSLVELNEALTKWKEKNCPSADSPGSACKRPVIIAASGGASRAGYFTVSVIGQLLDDELRFNGKGHGLTPAQIRERIFAISGVSGSSVGAVIAVAAMAASPQGKQPCKLDKEPLWHGDQPIQKWRSCLEALMSGDFLTPVVANYLFRDMLRFVQWNDRGVILEQSWERHFSKLIPKQSAPNDFRLACNGSLECPFLSLRSSADWLPLLLLNGTSVKTGQRIITSPLNYSFRVDDESKCQTDITDEKNKKCSIFVNSFSFHNLIGSFESEKSELLAEARSDIRLSTAATNSARFPFISPPGEVRKSEKLSDYIVDGGYFENYGVISALELAQAMKTIDPALAPFVLVISNDPSTPEKIEAPKGIEGKGEFFIDLWGPVGAFANVRSAYGLLAVRNAEIVLDPSVNENCRPSVSHIRVWPQYVGIQRVKQSKERDEAVQQRGLSMSWWLSAPVQQYLSAQTEFTTKEAMPVTGHKNGDNINLLLNALKTNSGECGARALPSKVEIQKFRLN